MEVRRELEERLVYLIDPVIENLGFERLVLQLTLSRNQYHLSLAIDHTSRNISVADCERVSRKISDLLDESNFFDRSYSLEVSSPGFKRVLRIPKDFPRFISHRVRIRLKEDLQGKKVWIGFLKSVQDISLTIEKTEIGELAIPIILIERANLDE